MILQSAYFTSNDLSNQDNYQYSTFIAKLREFRCYILTDQTVGRQLYLGFKMVGFQ